MAREKSNKNNEVKLKVVEALQDDAYKGIARIDTDIMRKLGLNRGDVISIKGNRETVAIVDRAYPADIGEKIVRIDGIIRRNAKTGIGEIVRVGKVEAKEANKITIAPSQKGVMVKGNPRALKQGLLGRAVNKGDIVVLGGASRRRDVMSDMDLFSDIFAEAFSGMGGLGFSGQPKFVIASTQPSKPCIVTENTKVKLNPKAVEITEEKIPEVTYEDIGGLDNEIKKVREMVELPLKHPEIFDKLGVEPPKGVLLYGPPGTGKTLLAKAVANESEANFILINGPSLMSKFYGESEKNLRKKFEEAEKNSPSIIFIDELDAIASKREESHGEVEKRVVSQLLTLMDGLESRGKVVVMGATNQINTVDEALRRPGRFDREISINVPDKKGRGDILKIHTRGMPMSDDVNLQALAKHTYGFVGADLASLSKEAAMNVLRKVLPKIKMDKEEEIPQEVLENLEITKDDFREALKNVRPSAMREILVETPNIHWEDIGGLGDVKQEVQEAVEWPMKYPDSFSNVGIKAPRGILLYGPPGTGKTLLAKAVANESEANFIQVKGPELLCVSSDTNIFTDFCGVRTIEDFYEEMVPESKEEYSSDELEVRKLEKPFYTHAISEDGELIKSKIDTVHKLWVENGYNVKFSNNNSLTGSSNQPLLVFNDNEVKWKKLGNVEEGDLVAYPRKLSTFDKEVKLPFPKYKHMRKVKEDENNYYARIFSTKEITKLPKHMTRDLASFLGWFVSEGSVSEEAVCICNAKEEIKEEIKELFKQFVDEERIKVYEKRVVAYSTPLVKYLEEVLNQKLGTKKSHTIKCPNIITKSSEEIISSFLKAAFKGDGHIGENKIEYSTMSEHLAEGMTYMLTCLGIKYRFWQRKDGLYMITISGKKEMDFFKNKVLGVETSGDLRKEYNAVYDLPDIAKLLKEAKEELGLSYGKELPDGSFEHVISGRRKIGLLRLRRIMEIYDKYADEEFKKTDIYKTLDFISKGDVLWTRVEEKKEAKPQVMYDIETKEGSFVGGKTPMVLHNSKWVGESEKGIRKIFERARQVAPCIVFFDEIDSLANRRSSGGSTGSRVTEQVLNQLLAEMDGLEDLQNVTVIGATNRPDMLDPALLRPGRFDRILSVTPPQKEGREAIFKVHTKNMPIDDKVDLKEMAKKTDGFVGADIESVCREAGLLTLRESRKAKKVKKKHFNKALKKVGPSVSKETMDKYRKVEEDYLKSAKAALQEKASYLG